MMHHRSPNTRLDHNVREKSRGWYTIDYQILESLHTSKCEGTDYREFVEPILDMCSAHTSGTEMTSESSQKKQQQSAAAFLEKLVKQEASNQSLAPLVDQAELVDNEPELVDEDHDSDEREISINWTNPETPPLVSGETLTPMRVRPIYTDSVVDPPEPQELETSEYRQILSEVRLADISLSPELQRLVLKSSAGVIRDALAALLERRQKSTVTNPAGYLYRAIEGQWKPTVPQGGVKEGHRRNSILEEVRPPSVEQLSRLDECKAAGTIKDYYFSGDGIRKVVMPDGRRMLPWWEFVE